MTTKSKIRDQEKTAELMETKNMMVRDRSDVAAT